MFFGIIVRMLFMDTQQHHLPHLHVEYLDDYRLDLVFGNGERRRFDMRPYLHYPVFRRLTNHAFFSLAHIDYGTVVWPGEIDIAPETLYDRSVPIAEVSE